MTHLEPLHGLSVILNSFIFSHTTTCHNKDAFSSLGRVLFVLKWPLFRLTGWPLLQIWSCAMSLYVTFLPNMS